MNESKVAHESEATSEPMGGAPESGRMPKAELNEEFDEVEYLAESLERWFRTLRGQVDSLYLCLHDTVRDGRIALGTDEVAQAAMVDAVRCQMEFDHLVGQVRKLRAGADPVALQAVATDRKVALAELIDNEAATILASMGGARGQRFATALEAMNDAVDAEREARRSNGAGAQ
jgi:hypothetical protein